MNRKVRSAIIRILFISGLPLIPLLISCGKSIENAQDFIPNDPPVIESCTVTDNTTGKEVDASNIILGMTLKCAVKAYDPEGKALEYSFKSDYVSLSSESDTADGCDGVFVVTKVVANTPVTLTVAVRDPKDASATELIPIGTGKEGPLLTLGSPVKAGINNSGSTTFSFACTSDGWYQVLESGDNVSGNPSAYMNTSTKYTAGAAKTATVGGPSYSGAVDANTVKVSSGDGVKKIWIIFKDNNNYYSASEVSVTLDSVNPTVISTTPADGATNVSTSPTLSVVFSETMSNASLATALTIAGGTVSYIDYNGTTHTARYGVTGLSKNTAYNAIVANAKDVAGNTVSANFSFTTTPTYSVTYDGNTSDGGTLPSAAVRYDAGQTVTVLGNTGPLTKSGNLFLKWNTQADGGGVSYTEGSTFPMPSTDVTLYAIWKDMRRTLTYVCSGYTRGSVPAPRLVVPGATVTVSSFKSDKGYLMKQEDQNASTSKAYYCKWTTGSSVYSEEATFIMPDSDVTLTASWNEFFGPYPDGYGGRVICRGPSGGYIVYDKGSYSNGWRYMEVAASDQSANCLWWKDQTITVGGTVSDLGKGAENTSAIVTRLGSTESYAALICRNCSDGGYTDWFLPSLDEMTTIRSNIGSTYVNTVCGFQDCNYWTSSESSASSAYYVRFQTTWSSAATLKNNPYGNALHARAARRF